MMNFVTCFPRGIAKDNAFCNRENERKRLIANMQSRQHTLLMSPRRYGKTSLVRYAARELDTWYGEADLFVAVDAKRIEQQILTGIKTIIGEVCTSMEQALDIIRQYFAKTSKKWTVGTQGINIALIPDAGNDPATTILEALQTLENLLSKKQQRAVLFIDEIQEIGEVAEGKGIEGALRHAAQETEYLSFVFSGSNRRLLTKMFYDKARPLYKLCDRIILDRIDENHYKNHLNKFARQRWNANLEANGLATIFHMTDRHPFYMNVLCLRLWQSSLDRPPLAEEVIAHWHSIVEEERAEVMLELSKLSHGQRKLLIAISKDHTNKMTGKAMLIKTGMTSSSIVEALQVLQQNDYIEKQKNGDFRLIDPLVASSLRMYFEE